MKLNFRPGALAGAVIIATTAATPAEAQPTPRGRIHLDAAYHDDDVTPLRDSIRLRRGRIGVQGSHGERWSYTSEVDLAEDAVDWKDAFLRYNDLAGGRLQIGQFKVPFSLEQLTSSNNITFMERSSADMFAPARRLGIGWSRGGNGYTVSVMGFGQEIGTAREGDDDGLGAAARVTFAPISDDDRVLHLGFAVANYQPEHSNNAVMRFRQHPESRPAGTRLIDTGVIGDVDTTAIFGAEAAWVHGPLSLQGEYMTARVRRTGAPNPRFNGWYVYLSYFLTGESRGYGKGVLSGPNIRNDDRGAWEIALRYSESHLDDGPIQGGTMENITFGVNWYARPNVRFMFNYVNVSATRLGEEDKPSIFQLRTHVHF